jgi:hypothetical protein
VALKFHAKGENVFVLTILVGWRLGPYADPDQQGDTNKQNQKRVYVNEEKANVCRFPCLTLRCDPHEARIYGVSNKKPLFNCV